jgi:hypothetical protein
MKTKAIVLGLCAAAALFAQAPPAGRGRGFGPMMGPGARGEMMGMGRGGAMGRPVTGAPYSGVEVTQTVQTLPNGNVISQSRQTTVYRDGQGRVRTETTMPARPGESSGQPRTIVSIHDPVAGVNMELDPQTKTVHQSPEPNPGANGFRGRGAATQGEARNPRPDAAGRPNPGMNRPNPPSDPNTVTETLSAQVVNGVMATGTRVTRTIPAGQIGNAAAIQTVRETWMSSDLRVPVMTRVSDPRTGTITTQLTNINRAEPDASLFQAPPDYTVVRGGRGPGRAPGAPSAQ